MSNSLAIEKKGTVLSATLLITGCCVGAGMIGLPVISALAGFMPTTVAMILCYFFATATGLLLLEATLWFDQEVNLISMTNFALGKYGKLITWGLFLFLFYCLFVAYIEGGGQLFADVLSSVFQTPIAREVGILTCVGLVAAIVYAGTQTVSTVARVFLVGLVGSYCALLFFGIPHVSSDRLLYSNWPAFFSTLPVLLICFGYQNLIPTLTYYVKRNVRTLRYAIFFGNLIPFIIYFVWNAVILGILTETNVSAFEKIASQGEIVTGLLENASNSPSVLLFAKIFSFFAVLTPFMMNTLAFVDFLKDGIKLPKESKYGFVIYGLVFIPPTILTLFYPHLFLKALGLAGGFADVILFGILPVLIVWYGRYVKNMKGPYTVAGGKLFLILILSLSVGFLFLRG